MSRRKQYRWPSAELNNATYDYYFNYFRMITENRIKIENLPDTVDERYLFRGLFHRGKMLMFKDEIMGMLCLEFTTGGLFDVYKIPTRREAYASNGYRKVLTKDNSVIINNNFSHLPDEPSARMFAQRIADLQRTIDVNVIGQKTPKLITGTEDQKLAMKNLYMQWEGNEPFIFGDNSLNELIKVGVLDTTAPYVADKLEIQKHMLINEYLTSKGIANSNNDKRERLVADEVNSNAELVETFRNVYLNSLKQDLDKVNKMFGTNMIPVFRTLRVDTPFTEYAKEEGEEV